MRVSAWNDIAFLLADCTGRELTNDARSSTPKLVSFPACYRTAEYRQSLLSDHTANRFEWRLTGSGIPQLFNSALRQPSASVLDVFS
jgi:hypothetical protein